MMYERRAADRGHADFGWLNSHHTFSFGNYYDPDHMGFGPLRVINDDRVAPGGGFGEHGHQDMEIVSVVLSGGLEHRDSMGNGSVIRPGDVQRMSAGTGVRHSEFNASADEDVHFLQIWVLPEAGGMAPGYEQKHFPVSDRRNQLKLLASPDGRDDSITIHQDVLLYGAELDAGATLRHDLAVSRKYWLHVYAGEVGVDGGVRLGEGDGLGITAAQALSVTADSDAGFLLFDMVG